MIRSFLACPRLLYAYRTFSIAALCRAHDEDPKPGRGVRRRDREGNSSAREAPRRAPAVLAATYPPPGWQSHQSLAFALHATLLHKWDKMSGKTTTRRAK